MGKQEKEYQKMIDEENKKHLAVQKKMEEEKRAKEEKIKMEQEILNKKKNMVGNLKPEPKSGEIIKVSLRLPNGNKVLRSFNKSDAVEVRQRV